MNTGRSFVIFLAHVLALPFLLFSTSSALAEKRVALVIGNGAYQNAAKLPNPVRDAGAIAEMFRKAGFDRVDLRQDLDNLQFKRALREFSDAAQDADIAVVYYSGFGIQVRDMNYMIPVDARLATEIDAEDEAVSLDRIVMALEPAKRLRLVILDACRDNPFVWRMKRRVGTQAVSAGLAKTELRLSDTLIVYAAKAGSTSQDGAGVNSPLAAALLKNLTVPGLDIRLALGRMRDDVLKLTGNRQEPFVYGALSGEAIALVPAPAEPRPEALSDVKADYELVARIGTKKAWEAFLSSHKEGVYAELARAQLAKLTETEAAAGENGTGPPTKLAANAPVPPPRPSNPSSEERRVWDRIRDSGDRAKLRDFIAKYPASALAEAAQNRLDALVRAAEEQAAAQRPKEPTPVAPEESASKVAQSLGDRLRKFPATYNKPDIFYLGNSIPVELVIQTEEQQATSEMFKGFPGEIRTTTVRVGSHASAYLTGPKDMVEITLRGDPLRTVTVDAPISWIWDVRPLRPGVVHVILEVFSHVKIGTDEGRAQIRVLQDTWTIEARGLEWVKYQISAIEPIRAFIFALASGLTAALAYFGIRYGKAASS